MLRIEFERRRLKWSQEDLHEETGIAQKDISLIESGRLIPSDDQLNRLASALTVQPSALLREVVIED